MTSLVKVSAQVARALAAGLADGRVPLRRRVEILGGFLASGFRLAAGTVVARRLGPRPEQRLVLYDFERCPYSRAVREVLSALDLDAEVRPCPRGGTRFRPQLDGLGVPQLFDPNVGQTLRGSRVIIAHLHERYGVGRRPGFLSVPPVVMGTGLAARLLTAGRGGVARPSRAPQQLLELYSFESSPYCRIARATLSELELPYVLHNVAKGSPKRAAFLQRSGKMQVPYLVDPNTQVALFESAAIEAYLLKTYGG